MILYRMKQDQAERKRKDKLAEKLSTIRAEDRKKSREIGKKPFYLKKSAIKEIALEQRYVYVASIPCMWRYHTPVTCEFLYTLTSTLHSTILPIYITI